METDGWYLSVNTGNGIDVHGAIDSLMAFMPGVQVRHNNTHTRTQHDARTQTKALWLRCWRAT